MFGECIFMEATHNYFDIYIYIYIYLDFVLSPKGFIIISGSRDQMHTMDISFNLHLYR